MNYAFIIILNEPSLGPTSQLNIISVPDQAGGGVSDLDSEEDISEKLDSEEDNSEELDEEFEENGLSMLHLYITFVCMVPFVFSCNEVLCKFD